MTESLPAGPRIVALETSGRLGCVALAQGPHLLAERRFTHGMRHAVELLPTLRAMLGEQGWRPPDIEQLYVSTGPGSFTGLRIAITVARTLHQAIGCQLIGVPTLDVLAANAPVEVRHLVVVLDAKRGQIFAARYVREDHSELRRVAGPVLVDPTRFIRDTPRPVAVLGEGVEYHRVALRAGVDRPDELVELDKTLWPGTAAAVHALGWQLACRRAFTPPDELLPVYIRLAEAEEVWRKKRGLPLT